MHYRREIDGLRALAVLPVILFHGGIGPFSGGYVGVDVFFVISGYLITSIIAAELAAGTFTLKGFYERRARRILPALFLVLFACAPFAAAWLLPSDLRRFASSLIATVLMASNFYFAGQPSGYFDATTELEPLLHTWSLAVEEHYYLLFPLFLMVAWKWGRSRIVLALALITVASFACALWLTPHHPAASFYLLPTRAWEIAAGALVALVARPATAPTQRADAPGRQQGLAVLGLGLIAYAVFAFEATTPFPSAYTLVPVVGTVLLITCATQRTLVGRALGIAPLVGLGLVSYSAYLWHQPLFAFARQRSLDAPSTGTMLALAALSLVLATLSWRYVERPFRQRRFTRPQLVKYASWAAMILVQVGVTVTLFSGFPERLPGGGQATLAANAAHTKAQEDGCSLDKDETKLPNCVKGAKGATPHVALVGDSHAAMLVPALDRAFAEQGLAFVPMIKFGCPTATRFQRSGPGGTSCAEFQRNYTAELARPDLDTLIVVARWPNYLWGNHEYDNGEGGIALGMRDAVTVAGIPLSAPLAARQEALLANYTESLQHLLALGKRVILVYPIPEQGWNITSVRLRALLFGTTPAHPFAVSVASYRDRTARVQAALDALGESPALVRVHPQTVLCDTFVPGRCASEIDGKPLYSDDNHLTAEGAQLVVRAIMPVVQTPERVATR